MTHFYDYQMEEILDPKAVARLTRNVADLRDAVEKLAALGSADQIRDYLVQEQVFGQVGVTTLCVLARYFHRQTGAHIAVSSGSAWIANIAGTEVPLPLELGVLLCRFDQCKYPELDAVNKPRPNITDLIG